MTERLNFQVHDSINAQAFLQQIPSWVRRRGKELFAKGGVKRVLCEEAGRRYIVEVKTNWLYTVTLSYAEDSWDAECNCGQQFQCEHACAAMTALLGRQGAAVV